MKIIVTSGGTGGHIYPAVSLIKYLENNGEDVLFVGCENGMEREITKKESINFAGLNLSRGKGIISKIKFVIDILFLPIYFLDNIYDNFTLMVLTQKLAVFLISLSKIHYVIIF